MDAVNAWLYLSWLFALCLVCVTDAASWGHAGTPANGTNDVARGKSQPKQIDRSTSNRSPIRPR